MVLSRMLSGELEPSAGVREVLDVCLKCHQCADICPRGIDTVGIFLEGRSRLRGAKLNSRLTRLVFRLLLPRRWFYNLFMKIARWMQKILPKREGGLRHLPLIFEGKRNLPAIARKSALLQLPEETGKGPRVAFFTGCLQNYVYPETARNACKLIESAGCSVVVPKKQLCCGLAARYIGDKKTSERLARENVRVFSECGVEYVVTACATCATMLKKEYPAMPDSQWPAGLKVMELSEFLSFRGFKPKGSAGPVTYHDPCHMRYAQNVTEEPRKLLSAVAEVREPSEPGRCCGGGGTFSLFQYELSRKIGKKRVELLDETQAETVVTACPGCILQISDLLEGGMKIKHLADFLVEAAGDKNHIRSEGFVATERCPGAS